MRESLSSEEEEYYVIKIKRVHKNFKLIICYIREARCTVRTTGIYKYKTKIKKYYQFNWYYITAFK
jgi:hypothetical protein